MTKPFSPAAERNAGPILEVLQVELAGRRRVLEIGSGTGQHAVFFGARLPVELWQTSDLVENHAGIRAWLDEARLGNVAAPLEMDVTRADLPGHRFDAVFAANTAHIMSQSAVAGMFRLAAAVLEPDGVFCLYGPFRDRGTFNSNSNAAFHASLRAENPAMGIRDLEDLDALAEALGMHRLRRYAMPANNEVVIWRKAAH